MRKPAAAIAACLALAGPAAAADKPAPPKDPTFEMNPIGLPVVVGGQVVNYVFVTLRLNLPRGADVAKIAPLEPFFRDALVREGGRAPFVRPDNYAALDDARVTRAVVAAANAIAGRGAVVGATVVKEQPQHYTGLPKPPGKR